MPLKALLDSLEGLSDEIKQFYKPGEGEQAGKFVLDVEAVGGFSLENVEGLKNAFTATKTELEASKAAIDGFKGLNAQKVRTDLRELERLRRIDPETEAGRLAEAQITAKVEEVTRAHKTETEKLETRNKTLMTTVERLLIDNEASTELAKHKGVPELLLPVLRPRLRLKEDDQGQFGVQVLNEKGDQEYAIRDGKAVPATIEDLVVKLRADERYGRAFEATGHSGGGATPPHGGGYSGKNPWSKEHENITEQAKLLRSNPTLAAALKAQANA